MARWEVGGNCMAARASGWRFREAVELRGRRKRVRKAGIWKAITVRRSRKARMEMVVVGVVVVVVVLSCWSAVDGFGVLGCIQ